MTSVLPVLIIALACGLIAKIAVVMWDAGTDIHDFELHPAKLAMRVAVIALGVSLIAVLLYLILWLSHSLPTL